ncbi:MAG: glycosyltransferase family 4 protein [Candidatus Omnitrophica bacterium]|nr:glycosyltransferase family 4 protein [Candidatus Omnitrophota bacterium]
MMASDRARKPRVLLIPDRTQWILGTMAREIERWNPDHDFYVVSQPMIIKNPGRFKDAARSFDIVHHLNQYEYENIRPVIGKERVSVMSVHHVVDWERVSSCKEHDAVMTASGEWADVILGRGVPSSKVCLVPYGVDSSLFRPFENSRKERIRRSLGLLKHAFVIGFFSSILSNEKDRKGVDVFLESLRAIARACPRVSFLVVGPGWRSVVKDAKKAGIRVVNVGFVENTRMPFYYNALDVYWITSRIEGGPVPLLEAMSCGIPVISTPVGMARDIVTDGNNGFIFPKGDVSGFVSKSLELSELPVLARRIGEAGRDTVVSNHQWKELSSTIPRLYSAAMANAAVSKVPRSTGVPIEATFMGKDELIAGEEIVFARDLSGMGEGSRALAAYLRAAGRRPSLLMTVLAEILTRLVWGPVVRVSRRIARELLDLPGKISRGHHES